MKPRSLLYTFKQEIKVSLEGEDLSEACKMINFYHYGKHTIPLSVPSSAFTEEHIDAAYAIHRGRIFDVYIDVYSDGSFKVRTI